MSKERLKEIKYYYREMETLDPGTQSDINWLIEQAERVLELEVKKDEFKKWWQDEARYNNELIEQNERYREALEEIKKEETVTTALSEGQVAYTISGHIARKALEGEE